jgi:hypothetical protein
MKKLFTLLFVLLTAISVHGQDKSTGRLKGKVRVETGTPAGVSVVVRQGEVEVRRATTNKDGDFLVSNLKPGLYGVTFRKAGLSIGTIENVEVKAGKTRSLGDRLILTIDEGSIAFIRGSVFGPDDRSAPRVRVELARVLDDGSVKKIDGRLSDDTGRFVFRLTPDHAKYRVTVKPNQGQAVSKDVEVDGAAVYRIALSILPPEGK